MKRCPECRRDYYDDSLLYCLDDGTPLLEGPGSGGKITNEPATAILHETAPPNEAATRAQIHVTEPPTGAYMAAPARGPLKWIMAAVIVAVLAFGGYFGYRSLSASGQINSIAVMPFVNESGSPDVEYLSDGMTETLIKSLSNLPDMDVKPRSAVFRYKGKDMDAATVGKELNVHAVLNGRVVERGDQLTLSLELVDAKKNRVIWTEQYQRKRTDLVSLQSEIAKDVSSKLNARLSGADETKLIKAATTDPEAYQAYLKGRYYWNRRTSENIKKAMEQFKLATDKDPNYALALVGLADCYAVLNEYAGTPTSETLPQAKSYAERALAIDPQLAEAHATLGSVYNNSWQFADSEREFKRVFDLNPNYATAYHWYSIFLKDVGRYDEAAVAIQRAKELDPLSSVISVNITRMYQMQNNDDAAIDNALKSIELDPAFGPAYEYLALSYARMGRYADAIAACEKAVELSQRSGISLGDLGYIHAQAGKRVDAVALIKELEEKYQKHEAIGQYIAAVYAGLGDKDRAFEWLEKDFRDHSGKLTEVRWQMQFESLRDDPRFDELFRRVGTTK